MWRWLKTSLAASGPWVTKAHRRPRHWRINLCSKGNNIGFEARMILNWVSLCSTEIHKSTCGLLNGKTPAGVSCSWKRSSSQWHCQPCWNGRGHWLSLEESPPGSQKSASSVQKHDQSLTQKPQKEWAGPEPSAEKLKLTSLSTCFSPSSNLKISAHSMEILI